MAGAERQRPSGRPIACAVAVWLAALAVLPRPDQAVRAAADPHAAALFTTSHDCSACHNGLTLSSGEDVSIGVAWRASIMANSSRDPYWQASVRRETIDHPSRGDDIEDECSVCHMPMARAQANAAGRKGQVFAHLPIGSSEEADAALAADGVSCALCHQIGSERLGEKESFVGRFVLGTPPRGAARPVFGPFAVDAGRATIMRSATGLFTPTEASHVQTSELCATCHTLITEALGPDGRVIGSIPEQVPYQEWRHSAYRNERSCQSCHMPEVAEPTRIASVVGRPREGLSRHTFIGGNFFMLRLLNRFRSQLGVEALPQELETSFRATVRQLQGDTAEVVVDSVAWGEGELGFDVGVRNLTGHKLPTGYPARRAWLHVTVRDASGRPVFESGAVMPDGSIAGNDNDADPLRFEPHYTEIRQPDQVQIYESIMADQEGRPTTGLLRAVSFVKDNRLLPRGFDKATAEADIAVRGAAAQDDTFTGGGDRVHYAIATGDAPRPFAVDVELRYQPIAFRWASNLRAYDAAEPKRFVGFYEAMASASSLVLAQAQRRDDAQAGQRRGAPGN